MSRGREKKQKQERTKSSRQIAISGHLRQPPLGQELEELLDAEESELQTEDPETSASEERLEDDTDPGSVVLDDDAYEPPQGGMSPFDRDIVQDAAPSLPSAALDARGIHPLWLEMEDGRVLRCRYLPRNATAGAGTADAWKKRKELLSDLAERLEKALKGGPMDAQAADKALDIAWNFRNDAEKDRRSPLARRAWLFWDTGCMPLSGYDRKPA